ncbi:hypothetical protein B566_EDAN002958 [Ephemera danica]|nr:hypothetical protein B566_EDAN002958 [Ephemera danica]
MNRKIPQYLLWFANEHIGFRSADLKAVANICHIKINFITEVSQNPFCIVELPGEKEALQLASRCISLRSILELWGQGNSYNELHENTFSYLPIEGPVSLNNPDVKLYLLEYYGLDPNNIPEEPYQLFFGRWIADGQRSLITRLSLKKRHFIGNTSMDAQLSLLMANQAQVQSGHLVLDPFVGSGSLLVAAAQFGGYVWGGDLDYLMLHGKSRPVRPNQKVRAENESIKNNLAIYGLSSHYLDVLVADAALPIWRPDLRFDAIITDPPYGIRESTERIGSWRGANIEPIKEAHIPTHIPSKVEYNLQHLLQDLLDFAARYLVVGGRLVFWLPIYSLPTHQCLSLESNCEQVLCGHTSRRLLTMVKTSEPDSQEAVSTSVPFSAAHFRSKYFAHAKLFPPKHKFQGPPAAGC